MPLPRYKPRRDANEKLIVATLRRVGATVIHLNIRGAPDLLVGYNGETHLIEIKGDRKSAILNELQEEWHEKWVGSPVRVVRTPEEALEVIRPGI